MSKNEKITEFMANLTHPLKQEMEEVIEIILNANSKVEGHIKWGGPSFSFNGDMATINPKITKYVMVIFHKAALLEDDFNFLEAQTKGKAYAKFYCMDDVNKHRKDLEQAVNAWVTLMENS